MELTEVILSLSQHIIQLQNVVRRKRSFKGSWVWKVDTFPRIKTFIWQCLHNSIGVGECLVKRRLSETDCCPLCQREAETILHRLRDCESAKITQSRLGILSNSCFYEGNLYYWLKKNWKDNVPRVQNQPPWRIIFPFVIWHLLKQRNNFVFRNRPKQNNAHSEALFHAAEFFHCVINPKLSGS